MKNRARIAAAAAILSVACCPARRLPLTPEVVSVSLPIEQIQLENGLSVILHEDHRSPLVAVNIWYHVGSKDEPARRHGFAHLFEHLMFQGSRNVARGQYEVLLTRAGAVEHNGTTTDDRTEYFETVPADQLEVALWLESDRMGFLLDRLDQANFERERDVVKNERRWRLENAPYGLVSLFIREALYPPEHPYRHMPIGTPEDLDAATLEDVRAFWQSQYRPDNATLVIAGDIDRASARAMVDRYFGAIPRRPHPGTGTPAVPVTLDGERRLTIEAGVQLAQVAVTWPIPSFLAAGEAELGIAEIIVRRRLSSALNLREWTQSVSVQRREGQLGGRFEIVATLRPGVSPEKVLRVIDEEVDDLKRRPVKDQLLRDARAEQQATMLFGLERVTARARQFNTYHQLAHDAAFVNRDLDRRRKVGPYDVLRAVAAHLPTDRRVVAFVTPSASAPRCGRLVRGQ
jgi:zinc protease